MAIFEKHLDFDDVLIKPKFTNLESRSEVNLNVEYKCKYSNQIISGFPLILANMSCVATLKMAQVFAEHKCFVALHKFMDSEALIRFFNTKESEYSFYTIGITDQEFEKFQYVNSKSKISKICLDVANGYMVKFLDKVKMIREKYPNLVIMAGNIATPEGVIKLAEAGADIIKAGIGNGAFCRTRSKAGVGCKQFTVAYECGRAAKEMNVLCCSDGGCKTPADICKALGGGSHFAMVGSMFAGCEECESDWVRNDLGIKTKMFMYGMSSKFANDKYCGGLKEYRAAEGEESWVEYKGFAKDLILDIKGSVASCCTYTNTKNLQNLSTNCDFMVGI